MCKWIHTYSTLSLFSCSYSFTLPPIRSPISRGTHFPSYSFAFFLLYYIHFICCFFSGTSLTFCIYGTIFRITWVFFVCMYVCTSLNFCGAYHFYEVYIYLKKKYCACIMNTCKVYILEFCMFLLRSILSSFFFS